MLKKLFLATLLFFSTSFVRADYGQKIVGADQPVQLGELVALSVTEPEGPPANLVSTSVTWKVYDGVREKTFATDADGKVFFGAGVQPKRLLAIAAVTYLFVDKDGEKVSKVKTKTVFLSTEVVIGNDPDPQPPTPQPNPPIPEPSFPQGTFGLSKFVYDATKAIPASDRKRGAEALAKNFRSIAAAIAAGTLKSATDILKQTAELNTTDLTGAGVIESFEPFSDVLQEKLRTLFKEGKMKSPAEFQTAWLEIAVGLEGVK